jgi:GDP/UDP-N,N'-diacetylbacillosamine 2-epimerase (hydrolysing)
VLLLGDRGEMLAGAIAGVHLNLAVAHVHGGEVSGTVDELVRHAVSKLSHVHLAATADSARRLLRLGERPKHVHVVGAPGLDYLRCLDPEPPEQLAAELDLDLSRPIAIFTQHPVTVEQEASGAQMEDSLAVLAGTGLQTVATYPNSDAGSAAMLKALDRHRQDPYLRIAVSLGQRRYASLLKIASVMVGNSSSGIIEAPFFGLPVVNIGSRQAGRLRAENVIDVPPDRVAIRAAVDRALNDHAFITRAKACTNPYGDGHAGPRIARIIAELELGPDLLDKRIVY